MRISFYFPRETVYDSHSVRERPCGGTEKAVIFLGEALRILGHEVEHVSDCALFADTPKSDLLIAQNAEVFQWYSARFGCIWWAHHFADQPLIQKHQGYARALASSVVTLSSCQQAAFQEQLRIDSVVIGHGIWHNEVKTATKDPYRFIYASTPYRGLEKVPTLFRQLREAEPSATLVVASGMGIHGIAEEDQKFKHLYSELRGMDGVTLVGPCGQEELYRHYAEASYLLYPNIWPETYCLTLDEAIAHGCTPLVPPVGALAERVGNCFDFDALPIAEALGFDANAKPPRSWLEVAQDWERLVLKC